MPTVDMTSNNRSICNPSVKHVEPSVENTGVARMDKFIVTKSEDLHGLESDLESDLEREVDSDLYCQGPCNP